MSKANNDKIIKKPRKMFLFLPLKGFLPYAGLILGILIIIFQQSLWSYTEGIVGRILIDIIRFETRGQYTIEYEKVRFNVLKDQLRLTNFSVVEDTNVDVVKMKDDNQFALRSSMLSLNVNSLLDILIYRQIQIEGLDLIKPSLRIVDRRGIQEQDTVVIKSSKILNLVTQYLNEFKIQKLEIQNAKLDYTRINQDTVFSVKLADVSVEISQFEIQNPLSENDQVISSNHFEFELLNDSIDFVHGHLIIFDKLRGSSRDSLIRVENLVVLPENDVNPKMDLAVQIPYLEITGFDPRDLIFQDTLRASQFNMGGGSINLALPDSVRGKIKPTNRSFPTIMLEGIQTTNIDFSFTFPIQGIAHNMELKGLDINTSNLTIDETNLQSYINIIHDIDIKLKAREYSIDFASINHRAKLKNVSLDVENGYFGTDGIEITPYGSSGSRYKSSIRNVQFWGLNIRDALINQNLRSRKVLIRELNLDVVSVAPSTNTSLEIDYRNIYPLVRNLFPSIVIADFQIRDSNISYRNLRGGTEVVLDNISIRLDDILVDSLLVLNPGQILGAKGISIEGSKSQLKLKSGYNEFTSGPFELSTNSQMLRVDKPNFVSRYPTSTQFGSESVYASGVNWFDLIHGKDLLLDTLLITRPKVLVDKLDTVYIPSHSIIYTASPDFLDSLHIGNFSIINGELDVRDFNNTRVNLHEISGNIDEIQVVKRDNKLYWLSYKFYAEVGPFSVRMNNLNHIITGKGTSLSKSDSTLRLNQFRIRPIQSMESSDALFVSVPNIVITGIDLTHLLDSNLIVTNRALFTNPNVDIQLFKKKDEEQRPNAGTEKVQEKNGQQGIRFYSEQISVINSSLSAKYDLEDQLTGHFKSDWNDFSIHGLHITPETKINSDLSFFDHIELKSGGLSHSGVSKVDTFYIESLQLNSNDFVSAQNIVTSGTTDRLSFDGTIPNLQFYSNRWLYKVLNDDFEFDSLLISRPQMNLDITSVDTTMKGNRENQAFSINTIRLDSGKIHVNTGDKIYYVPEINLDIYEFDLEKKQTDLYSKSLQLNIKGIENIAPDSYSTIDISEINFSTQDRSLQILGLEVDPKFKKFEYGKELGYQTDWIHVASEKIELNGLDYSEYLDNGSMIINEGRISGLDLHLFRDKNIPFPADQVRYMPQKILADIEFPFTIKSLIADGVNIRYEELAAETSTPGYVDILNLTAGISNITNDSLLLTENRIMMVGANADIYNTGNLQADFEFDLSDLDGYHRYSAFLSKMPITEFNKMLEPTVNLLIKSGQVNEMTMHVEGNRDYVIGDMQFHYEDLHFNIISKKTGTTAAMGPALGGFFANTFIVNRNNPRLLFVRNGNIYFERDTTKSIVNYLTKAALSGVVSSIGARNNRKYINKANKESQEKLDKRKKREDQTGKRSSYYTQRRLVY